MVIRCSAELVPEASYPVVDPEQRMSLNRLVGIVQETVPQTPEPSIDDYFNAEPRFIETGLYILPTNPRYVQAQHTARQQVPMLVRTPRTLSDVGVVFPVTEHAIVVRSSSDLAKASVTRTAKARQAQPSAEATRQDSLRSGAHTLIAKRDSQARLLQNYAEQRVELVALYRDIREPNRTRYKARNLERMRANFDESVHETIEVAAVFLELRDPVLAGLHRAAKNNMYNGNYSSAQFGYNWLRYIVMVGRHNGAKTHKVEVARANTIHDLQEYEPYLKPENNDEQPTST